MLVGARLSEVLNVSPDDRERKREKEREWEIDVIFSNFWTLPEMTTETSRGKANLPGNFCKKSGVSFFVVGNFSFYWWTWLRRKTSTKIQYKTPATRNFLRGSESRSLFDSNKSSWKTWKNLTAILNLKLLHLLSSLFYLASITFCKAISARKLAGFVIFE